MKKVTIYFLFVLLLQAATACDFIRTVAGRPTSDQIAAKAALIQEHEQAVLDSLRMEALIQQERQEEELARVMIAEMGYKMNDSFSFGNPLTTLVEKYYVIIGVYRTNAVADKQIADVTAKGFNPTRLLFNDGVQYVVMCSSNNLKVISTALRQATELGACPKDTWIYVND